MIELRSWLLTLSYRIESCTIPAKHLHEGSNEWITFQVKCTVLYARLIQLQPGSTVWLSSITIRSHAVEGSRPMRNLISTHVSVLSWIDVTCQESITLKLSTFNQGIIMSARAKNVITCRPAGSVVSWPVRSSAWSSIWVNYRSVDTIAICLHFTLDSLLKLRAVGHKGVWRSSKSRHREQKCSTWEQSVNLPEDKLPKLGCSGVWHAAHLVFLSGQYLRIAPHPSPCRTPQWSSFLLKLHHNKHHYTANRTSITRLVSADMFLPFRLSPWHKKDSLYPQVQ